MFIVVVAASCHRAPEHPPVILISIDTLRSDHLPVYGYKGVATPNIDALAKDGAVYRRAYAHVPLTLPSHVSILTGLLPQQHGVRDNVGYMLDSKKHTTLASLLKRAGYATGAAVSAYVLRGSTGISAGFDSYDDAIPVAGDQAVSSLQRSGFETEKIAERWIGDHASQPFFYFMHLYEPHSPYTPPPEFANAANPYDGEIAASDAIVGRLLTFLRSKNLYDKAVVILVSDHGEGLMDHGEQEHGILLYRESLQVPLIVKLPKEQKNEGRLDEQVQLIDIFPTIATLAHADHDVALSGHSLVEKYERAGNRVYAETLYPRIHLGWSELRSLVGDRFHYIEGPQPEMFDVIADPRERTNILEQQRRETVAAREAMAQYGREMNAPSAVSPEDAARLQALGYTSAAHPQMTGALPDPKTHLHDLEPLKTAASLVHGGNCAAAIPLLDKLLTEYPRWSDVRDDLGRCYEENGNLERAEATYKGGIEVTPELAGDFALSVATVQMELGKFADAEKHARLALGANPPAAHQTLGEIALMRHDFATAHAEADVASRFPTQKILATYLFARIAAAQNDPIGAMTYLDEVQALAAKERVALPAHYHVTRGDLLARTNRFQEAEGEFRQAMAADPTDLEAYTSLALMYRVLQREPQMNAILEEMARANPGKRTLELAARSLTAWDEPVFAAQWKKRAGK